MVINLTKKDTSVLKGIALLMLLWHHLFFVATDLFDDIHLWGEHYLVNTLGLICKLCVAIFVFLSGYGLTIQANNKNEEINYLSFVSHRVFKLFPTFWLIWLLFVPYGVFVLGRTPDVIYGSYPYLNLFLDITGLLNVFGKIGYNGSWWFMSCILVLYFIFPLLYKFLKSNPLYAISGGNLSLLFIQCNILHVKRLIKNQIAKGWKDRNIPFISSIFL